MIFRFDLKHRVRAGAVLAVAIAVAIATAGAAARVPTGAVTGLGRGWTTTSIGPGDTSIGALLEQPDGKLVAAGTGLVMGSGLSIKREYMALVRYNPDGSLDTSFGHGGRVTTSVGRDSSATGLIRQPDGKLVVAGISSNKGDTAEVSLVRYNTDGSLDTGFGHGGAVTTQAGGGVMVNAITTFLVRQPNGKLVAATMGNRGTSSYIVLIRYNPNGRLDTGFGAAGKAETRINTLTYFPSALVLQTDGKLVAAAGTSSAQTHGDYAIVRYNTNGSLDTSYGADGKVIAAGTSDNDIYEGLAVLPDGDVIAAGAGSSASLALTAYAPNGKPDKRWGHDGTQTPTLSQGSISYDGALLATPDGKIIAAGAADVSQSGPTDSFILRYNRNGRLDQSFGRHGEVLTGFAGGGLAWVLLYQQDGKLIAAGSSATSTRYTFALARFNSNGTLDTSFGK